MIDLERALRLALDAGDAVPRSFVVDVRLSMTRMIGLAAREQTTSVSRDTDDPLQFTQRCARAWKALEDQHHKTREATGI